MVCQWQFFFLFKTSLAKPTQYKTRLLNYPDLGTSEEAAYLKIVVRGGGVRVGKNWQYGKKNTSSLSVRLFLVGGNERLCSKTLVQIPRKNDRLSYA
jgi:hypothetical protein